MQSGKTRSMMRLMAMSVCAMLFFAGAATAQSVRYVDDDSPPGGDGLSWATAYTFLQDALAEAAASGGTITEIRVGQGTYWPDEDEANPAGTGDRVLAFEPPLDIQLNGGYAGFGAPDPDALDVNLFETILTGDLANDDIADFSNHIENSFNVLRVRDNSPGIALTVFGFTITGGNANDPLEVYRSGGGFFFDATSEQQLTVLDCLFTLNQANNSGGLLVIVDTALVQNCRFIENKSLGNTGGLGASVTNLTVEDCHFEGNVAQHEAGGYAGRGLVINSVFINNVAGYRGGGAWAYGEFRNCRFEQNQALRLDGFYGLGAGLYILGTDGIVVDCVFIENHSVMYGGGIEIVKDAMIVNCLFLGNSADNGGGAIGLPSAINTEIVNCLFIANTSDQKGSAIYVRSYGDHKTITYSNCTFYGNVSANTNGGALVSAGSNDLINNCIFWNNSNPNGTTLPAQFRAWGGGPFNINHTCAQNWDGSFPGTGNTAANPLFVDPDGVDNVLGNDDDDLRLSVGSPGIDTGHNYRVARDIVDLDSDANVDEFLPFDLDGQPRVMDDPAAVDDGCGVPAIVDMGPYEAAGSSATICVLDTDGNGQINVTDLLALLGDWGLCSACCLSDFDLNGSVSVTDLLALLAAWGPCP